MIHLGLFHTQTLGRGLIINPDVFFPPSPILFKFHRLLSPSWGKTSIVDPGTVVSRSAVLQCGPILRRERASRSRVDTNMNPWRNDSLRFVDTTNMIKPLLLEGKT